LRIASLPAAGLELVSLITAAGELELALETVEVRAPGPEEVVVRMEATPINPSDIGLLFGAADLTTLRAAGTPERPAVTASVPAPRMPGMAGRVDQPLPVGNEGAGVVIAAGASVQAQELVGRTVAVAGGGMYAQYRVLRAADCLPLPPDATPADGASAFINPLTVLGMVETMKADGHTALVHTAAASNLGQMLDKLCRAEGIGLVNIVRSDRQAHVLRENGATHVCNSSAPSFMDDLTQAVVATGATLAFDAIGGGTLAGQILAAMENAANRNATTYSRYGSSVYKHVYIYGGLDTSPTVLNRSFGMTWGIGGWLLFQFIAKIGPARTAALRARVVAELKTTFASRYTRVISLREALDPQTISAYSKRATGEKYLIDPSSGLA
jgi:NADPH:quinone reductase-like Zn-dependent oxidoreductase